MESQQRAKFVAAAIAMFIVLITLGGLGYVRATDLSNESFRKVSVGVCAQRTQQSRIIQEYLDAQAQQIRLSKTLTTAEKETYLTQSARLREAFPVVDCSTLANPK